MCKTGKVRHHSRVGALILVRKLKNKAMNVYRCPHCGGWHLGNSRNPNRVQARIDQLLAHHK